MCPSDPHTGLDWSAEQSLHFPLAPASSPSLRPALPFLGFTLRQTDKRRKTVSKSHESEF